MSDLVAKCVLRVEVNEDTESEGNNISLFKYAIYRLLYLQILEVLNQQRMQILNKKIEAKDNCRILVLKLLLVN